MRVMPPNSIYVEISRSNTFVFCAILRLSDAFDKRLYGGMDASERIRERLRPPLDWFLPDHGNGRAGRSRPGKDAFHASPIISPFPDGSGGPDAASSSTTCRGRHFGLRWQAQRDTAFRSQVAYQSSPVIRKRRRRCRSAGAVLMSLRQIFAKSGPKAHFVRKSLFSSQLSIRRPVPVAMIDQSFGRKIQPDGRKIETDGRKTELYGRKF